MVTEWSSGWHLSQHREGGTRTWHLGWFHLLLLSIIRYLMFSYFCLWVIWHFVTFDFRIFNLSYSIFGYFQHSFFSPFSSNSFGQPLVIRPSVIPHSVIQCFVSRCSVTQSLNVVSFGRHYLSWIADIFFLQINGNLFFKMPKTGFTTNKWILSKSMWCLLQTY